MIICIDQKLSLIHICLEDVFLDMIESDAAQGGTHAADDQDGSAQGAAAAGVSGKRGRVRSAAGRNGRNGRKA